VTSCPPEAVARTSTTITGLPVGKPPEGNPVWAGTSVTDPDGNLVGDGDSGNDAHKDAGVVLTPLKAVTTW
jgi:hypothetical protein